MKSIKQAIGKRITRFLCAIVPFIATVASQNCQIMWYQEVEPDGLDDYVVNRKH